MLIHQGVNGFHGALGKCTCTRNPACSNFRVSMQPLKPNVPAPQRGGKCHYGTFTPEGLGRGLTGAREQEERGQETTCNNVKISGKLGQNKMVVTVTKRGR